MTASPALKRMVAARTALILDEPFFGALALKLQLVEDPSCKTAWTDGTRLGFSPAFVLSLSHAEIIALFEHEVMHCANGHPWRRDGREPRSWNEACDRAINPIIRDAGGKLPEGALFELEPSHAGMSAEWIFSRLPQPQGQDQGGNQGQQGGQGSPQGQQAPSQQPGQTGEEEGQGKESPADFGEVRDAATADEQGQAEDGSDVQTQADWEQAVQQAAQVAKAQGKLPGSMQRTVKELAKSRVDWRAATHRFLQEYVRADYSWTRPNSRFMPSGLYLPGLRNQEMGALAVGIDTSGSIDQVALAQFGAELNQIVSEVKPRRVDVIYCDSRIHRVDSFLPGEPIRFNPVGGGGTDFRPVFDELDKLEDMPVAVVYFTDLYGRFPESEPEVPTLWVSWSRNDQAPFGEVVKIDT